MKTYLGDAVYVDSDGYCIWLTTEDGVSTTNRIGLEPEVLQAFLAWLQSEKGSTNDPR